MFGFRAAASSSRKNKASDAKDASEANAATDQQVRSLEADAFRGVHLDPNAHHWDEVSDKSLFIDVSEY